MQEDIIERVTPSGVPFAVRNLLGEDQDTLTKQIKKSGEGSAFNQMITSALRRLGNLTGDQIKAKVVNQMLSNDRAFVLLTMRQHSLGYKPSFDFRYDWPLRVGSMEKEVVDYSVTLNHKNFPVVPYIWMRDFIKKKAIDNPDYNPDGHLEAFPVIYEDYDTMLSENTLVTGTFPKSGLDYQWEVLNGLTENNFSAAMNDDLRVNLMLEMRKPKWKFVDATDRKKDAWVMFETKKSHIIDLEHLRNQIKEVEGTVDTSLAIQHPTDMTRRDRVNLVSLPVFFFPSLAR